MEGGLAHAELRSDSAIPGKIQGRIFPGQGLGFVCNVWLSVYRSSASSGFVGVSKSSPLLPFVSSRKSAISFF